MAPSLLPRAASGVPLSDLLRPTQDPDNVTIAALAAELGASTRTIREYALWMKLAYDPLDRTISAEDADKLRDLYQITGGAPPGTEDAEPVPTFLKGPVNPEYDPAIASLERVLNVPSYERQDARNQPRRRRRSRPREPELTGTAAAARRHWPDISTEEAQRIATTWTGRYLFTDAQAANWWKAGLHYREVELAYALASVGVEPWMVELEINKDTVLYKVRNGLAVEHAANLLRRAGHLKAG